VQSLDYFELLGEIEKLDVSGSNRINDLKPLGRLSTLSGLFLNNFDVKDLTPIGNLKNLETLWLQNFKNIESVDVISNLINLRKVLVHYLPKVRDLSSFAKLPLLSEMLISDLNSDALKSLHLLKNLRKLDLHTLEKKMDIESNLGELSALTNLETLSIGNSNRFDQKDSGARKIDEKLKDQILDLNLPKLSLLRINRRKYDLKLNHSE
jgi:hypothetical protein